MDVLDIACGPGAVTVEVARRGARVVGIDFAGEMVEAARRTHPELEFRQGDAAALPFDGASFDAVVCGFGLHHMAQPLEALREAHRVLRPGGRVAFIVWDAPETWEGFNLVMGAMAKHLPPPAQPEENPPLFGIADEAVLTGVASEAGFVEPRFERVPIVWDVPSTEAVYEAFRAWALLDALPAATQDAIRADVLEAARAYEVEGRVRVPQPAVLVSAWKS